ncbi:MAG TPA: DUF6457 domain-containing protein [Propionibacteriaceae bacterium]
MNLEQWLTALSDELELGDVRLDETAVATLLDLARDCAHEVERVAAPLTTYLVGVAVGRGLSLSEAAGTATTRLLESEAPPPGD